MVTRAHVVADANHDIPLAVAVTEGNQSDTTYLDAMVEETMAKPEVVIVDRGYDSKANSDMKSSGIPYFASHIA